MLVDVRGEYLEDDTEAIKVETNKMLNGDSASKVLKMYARYQNKRFEYCDDNKLNKDTPDGEALMNFFCTRRGKYTPSTL